MTYLHTSVPITTAYNNIYDECRRTPASSINKTAGKQLYPGVHAVFCYALAIQQRLSAAQHSGVALSSPFAHSIFTADPQKRRLPENPEVQRIRRETAGSMGFSLSKVNNSVRPLSADEVKLRKRLYVK